jgi:hypothetical protein
MPFTLLTDDRERTANCSGRDAHRWAPPGQIRTSAINAYGSYDE